MKTRASYADKMRQANHEAKATLVGLAVVIVAWIALGFGVAGTGIEVFHTPLWVVTGTVGTWIVAIVVAVVMSNRVIVDVDLEDEVAVGASAGALPDRPHAEEAGEAHE